MQLHFTICPVCGQAFLTVKTRQIYCSRKCFTEANTLHSATFGPYFWSRVDKSGPAHPYDPALGPYWEWQRSGNGRGYGFVRVDGRRDYAHRVAFQLANGPIPEGLHILHSCDNPLCCNPGHLSLGTMLDNMADMRMKQRHKYGEKRYNAALKETDVRIIRELAKTGMTQRALSSKFGISQSNVHLIVNRKTWKHVA